MFQRKLLTQSIGITLAAALATLTLPALAQNYPAKGIRFIVGYVPGGPNDLIARVIGQRMSEAMGVPVPVDNRPGADAMIGTQMAARAAPDGYTLSMISASTTIHPSIYSNVPYDVEKDFSPVSVLGSTAFVLVVNPALPAKSVKELIAIAKARPGQLNFASSGLGGTLHLAGELFKSMAHVSMTHVPYKGGSQAATDVVSGQCELMFGPLPAVMPHVRTGRLRMLAVTTAKRWPGLPDVPTVAESLPGYEASGWYAMVAPAHTPTAIITRINQEVVKALAMPETRKQFAQIDVEPIGSSPEQMASLIKTELVKWAKAVHDAGLTRGTVH